MSTKLTETVYQWLHNSQFRILPGICILCRRPTNRHQDLCQACENGLNRILQPCHRCGINLPPGYTDTVCGSCLILPPPCSRLIAPFAYSPPVSGMISRYKYQGRLVNGRVLTELLLSHLKQVYTQHPMPDLLVPMPLHRKRLVHRGFNQAREISRRLSRNLCIPENYRILKRPLATEHQAGLSARQRRDNIRGAFLVEQDNFPAQGCRVALVDDVVTTAATANEAARALLKAGAAEVHVWALARTVL